MPAIEIFPTGLAVTTAPFWDAIVDWITLNLYDVLQAFRGFLLVEILIPFRNFLVGLPWVVPLLLVMWIGFELRGLRLAVPVGLLLMFIASSGFWPQAMITVYMTLTAVIIATAIGIPTGIWASRNSRAATIVLGICDLLQTFPSFVYLIPVIMLFKIGDVAAIFAVVVYAWVPAARYTIFGIRKVPDRKHRGGDDLWLHAATNALEGTVTDRVARDHVGRQPDHHVFSGHGGDRRIHWNARSRERSLEIARLGRAGPGARGGSLYGQPGNSREFAYWCVERASERATRVAMRNVDAMLDNRCPGEGVWVERKALIAKTGS